MSNKRKVKVRITKALAREAQANGWSGGQLMAVAMERAGMHNAQVTVSPNPEALDPTLRGGYVATANGHYPLAEHLVGGS